MMRFSPSFLAGRLFALCRLVKIEHSVFALPFAYLGVFLAAGGWPGWRPFLLLTLAMVAVRSFAMTVNRLADLRYDRVNPRTAMRPLVTGEITLTEASIFAVLTAVVFVAACAGMNATCLALSPLALGLAGFYSFTKRFTSLAHFVLGSVLGLAPLAGWMSVDPRLTLPAALFFFGVTFWVAGFDILYSCQDADFDREQGLHSLPAIHGLRAALAMARMSHANTGIFFLLAGWAGGLGWPYFVVAGAACVILAAEHHLVSAEDLSRVDTAFFTFNGIVSIALFLGALPALPGGVL